MLSRLPAWSAVALACLLPACSQTDATTTASIRPNAYSGKERECLARAMFFESHRSSRDGLIAVGTVVMNRVKSDQYPNTVCGVVGQKKQFAPGVLSRKMNSKALPDVMAAADAVLAGERHPAVHTAKFFHQAGLKFPYKNMHYVLEAGGNAFYEKRSRAQRALAAAERKKPDVSALAYKAKPDNKRGDPMDAVVPGQR